jgi:hypothetical protein
MSSHLNGGRKTGRLSSGPIAVLVINHESVEGANPCRRIVVEAYSLALSQFDGRSVIPDTAIAMNDHPLAVGMVVVSCIIGVAAAVIWLATDAGIPSETAVPVIVVVLLALRAMARRNTTRP